MENNTIPDPTENVKEILKAAIERQDSLRIAETTRIDQGIAIEIRRVDDKFKDSDIKYQIQFNAAKEALGIALIAQEKAVSAALDAAKEATGKAEIAMAKQFDLLSEKIDAVSELLNRNAGAQGIYVTHENLSNEMEKLRNSFESMLRPVVNFMNIQGGKQGAEDPVVHNLVKEVRSLQEARSSGEGKSSGLNQGWVYLIGIVSLCGTLIAIFFALSK